MVMPRLDVL